MRDVLRSIVPPRIRLWRSRALHWVRRDDAYFERKEREDFLRKSMRMLDFNGIEGDYVEFGCCGGMTFTLAGKASSRNGARKKRKQWAFDSFEGLPPQTDARDKHPRWVENDMSISLREFHEICRLGGLSRGDYDVVQGYYSDTLADTALEQRDRPSQIALAYIDCDLYSSTLDVLAFLSTRLRHGMILAFDDYFCASGDAVSGERQALSELQVARDDLIFSPYLTFGWHGMSFIVERRDLVEEDKTAVSRLRLPVAAARGPATGVQV